MNDNDLGLALERLVAERKRVGPSPALQRVIWAIPATTPPERRWLPRIDTGGFSMFSALRFAAAGVIVALFGGFLLAGILATPQDGEVLPAAVTESPSPMTSDELLSGMVTEEVEPGVFRVIGEEFQFSDLLDKDGLADYLVSGADGGIWLLQHDGFRRLGGDEEGVWPEEALASWTFDFEVDKDGTVWAAWERLSGKTLTLIYSLHPPFTGVPERAASTCAGCGLPAPGVNGDIIEITSDGTVWAGWDDKPYEMVFGYLGAEGWQSVVELPLWAQMRVSDTGDIWSFGEPESPVRRFVDGAWQEYDTVDLPFWSPVDIGPDGTVWGIPADMDGGADSIVRFDGSQWQDWPLPEWLAPDPRGWSWDGDEWVVVSGEPGDDDLYGHVMRDDLRVAPDGSDWVIHRFGTWGDQKVCTEEAGGVARFDGEAWARLLRDQCVESLAIDGDGLVWLLATESDARYPVLRVFVITPEALAANE